MSFPFHDCWIPLEPGHAVDRGWPAASGGRPHAVTWHWTATKDLAECRRLLGGRAPERRGIASAHYAIGRSFAEGIDRYVELENRSWHAGKQQTLRWDGRPWTGDDDKGSRTAVGIETVNVGYARDEAPAEADWIIADSPDGQKRLLVQPWTEEQIIMMIEVGRRVLRRFPEITPRGHHGHHDLCPSYKVDVSGFPFARVLRGIYDDARIPDVWTPLWRIEGRQQVLAALGFDPGPMGEWTPASEAALRRLQHAHGLVEDGMWTTFVSWKVYDLLRARGLELAIVAL